MSYYVIGYAANTVIDEERARQKYDSNFALSGVFNTQGRNHRMYHVIYRRPESGIVYYVVNLPNELSKLLANLQKDIAANRRAYGCPTASLKILTMKELVAGNFGDGKDSMYWPAWTALIIKGSIPTVSVAEVAVQYFVDD